VHAPHIAHLVRKIETSPNLPCNLPSNLPFNLPSILPSILPSNLPSNPASGRLWSGAGNRQ